MRPGHPRRPGRARGWDRAGARASLHFFLCHGDSSSTAGEWVCFSICGLVWCGVVWVGLVFQLCLKLPEGRGIFGWPLSRGAGSGSHLSPACRFWAQIRPILVAYVGFWNNLGGTTRVDDRRRAFVRDDPGVRAVGIPGGAKQKRRGAKEKK